MAKITFQCLPPRNWQRVTCLDADNQQCWHLALICTPWTMFFGAGVLQNLPRADALVLFPLSYFTFWDAPHWCLTSWYTCPQTAE